MNNSMQDHIEQKSLISFDTLTILVPVYHAKFVKSILEKGLDEPLYSPPPLLLRLLQATHAFAKLHPPPGEPSLPQYSHSKTFMHDAIIQLGNIIVSDLRLYLVYAFFSSHYSPLSVRLQFLKTMLD